MDADNSGKALAYALKLLGYRQRSERELSQRLDRKGFTRAEAMDAVDRLKEAGYVDDAATARMLKDHAEGVKCLGRHGAKSFMRVRGIGSLDADEALEEYDEESAARRLLARKLRALEGQPRQVARRRLAGYLSRRGFSSEVTRKLLQAALDGALDEE